MSKNAALSEKQVQILRCPAAVIVRTPDVSRIAEARHRR